VASRRGRPDRATSTKAAVQPETSWAEACCQIAGVVVPLAFLTAGVVGFEATKVLLLRLVAGVLVLGWLGREAGALGGLNSGDGQPFAWRGRLGELRRGPAWLVLIGVVALGVSVGLASVTSIQPMVSLLGSWDRQQGLVTTLSWLALGVGAAITGRRETRRRGLVVVWSLASVPICLYAFVQQFHLDPVAWLNQPLGVASTLGSSTALATYVAMVLQLTIGLLVDAACRAGVSPAARPTSRRRWARLLADPRVRFAGWAALVVAQVAALMMTQVRGGMLAAGVGLIVTVGVLIAARRPRMAMLIGAPLAALMAVAAVVLAVVPRADVGDGTDTSAYQRLLIWQDAISSVSGPRLALGYGPETQMVALEPGYPVDLAQRFPNARFDRAHNLLLDQLVTTGLIGVGALLVVLWAVARVGLLRVARSDTASTDADTSALTGLLTDRRCLDAGLLGAFAASLAANLVAFDSSATGALFWMIAGLIVAPSLPPEEPAPAPAPPEPRSRRRQRRGQRQDPALPIRTRVTAGLAVLAVGLAAIPWLTAPFLADLYHTRALALRAGEAPGSSIRQELNAAQSAPWLDVPLLALGDAFLDLARTSNLGPSPTPTSYDELFELTPTSRTAQFEAARLALERAAAINPRDPYPHAYLARLWMMRAEASRDPTEQADLYGRAVSEYDLAIAAGPSRVGFYDEAGVALTRWNRPELALERFAQADALTRPTSERLSRMADARLAQGDAAAARALFEQALSLDARSAPAHAGLAALDRKAGDLPSALDHAQKAARYKMRDWIYHRDLATLYRDTGDLQNGLLEARTARRLAPAWQWDDLNILIQSLASQVSP
jgi:tetratricopeptide (TPR) repeat protein